MTFSGACKISVLAHCQQIFVAPLLFSWVIIIHHILEITIAPLTMLLTGVIITVYQQFNAYSEDISDGFFEHCLYNSLHPFVYPIAKSVSVLIGTLLPMALMLLILGENLTHTLLIFSQWIVLSFCVSCVLSFMQNSNPLNLLLGWLPLLTAPLVFLADFLLTMNGNSILILLGCDIILISVVFVPFTFRKS